MLASPAPWCDLRVQLLSNSASDSEKTDCNLQCIETALGEWDLRTVTSNISVMWMGIMVEKIGSSSSSMWWNLKWLGDQGQEIDVWYQPFCLLVHHSIMSHCCGRQHREEEAMEVFPSFWKEPFFHLSEMFNELLGFFSLPLFYVLRIWPFAFPVVHRFPSPYELLMHCWVLYLLNTAGKWGRKVMPMCSFLGRSCLRAWDLQSAFSSKIVTCACDSRWNCSLLRLTDTLLHWAPRN